MAEIKLPPEVSCQRRNERVYVLSALGASVSGAPSAAMPMLHRSCFLQV